MTLKDNSTLSTTSPLVTTEEIRLLNDIYPPAPHWAGDWLMIHRHKLYEDAMAQLLLASGEALQEGINVKFLYEEGSGPGMTREFFHVLGDAIFSSNRRFWKEADECKTCDPSDEVKAMPVDTLKKHYQFHGRFVALSLKMRIALKRIPNVGCFEHLLSENPVPESKAIEQTCFQAFKQGFQDVCDVRQLSESFSAEQLQMFLLGKCEAIDVEDWKSATSYEGFEVSSSGEEAKHGMTVEWFWRFVANCSSEDKAKLLLFCTGTSQLPFEGISALAVDDFPAFSVINAVHLQRDSLPCAKTCFNQLFLPEFSSFESLESKFNIALNYCTGFFNE